MDLSRLGQGATIVLALIGMAALLGGVLHSLGLVVVVADDSTKFLVALAALIALIFMFGDRLSKLTLPGGIIAELSAVRTSIQEVTAVAHDIKLGQTEAAAPQMQQAMPNAQGVLGAEAGSTDVNLGLFGGSPFQNGLLLKANVVESRLRSGWYRVDLRVESSDRALKEAVEFHLHESFVPKVQVVNPVGQAAQLTVLAWGAFTVGAVTDHGATRLELDLSKDSTFPEAFRAR